MDFTICIANTTILIHSVYQSVFNLCKEYLITEDTAPDIEIYSTEEMIQREYEILKKRDESAESLQSVERLLIQRIISDSLIDRDIVLMHGAVIAVNNNAYMFTAKSGTGKTTQIRKWLKRVPGSVVVNGDKPFVMLNKNGAYACGTPWCGKESMGNNMIVPLRSIVFMKRSNENRIETASFNGVFPALIEQTYYPSDTEKQRRTLALLMKLKDCVSFFNFYFDHYQEGSFRIPFETLTEQNQKQQK